MAKEIDRVRAQGALAVIKQHPGMVLFAVSPGIAVIALVWWLVSPALAVLLLIGAVVVRRSRPAHEALGIGRPCSAASSSMVTPPSRLSRPSIMWGHWSTG